MEKRHLVQIPAEQVQKLADIKSVRKDLSGFPLSKVVHTLLQERLAELFHTNSFSLPDAKGKWFEYIREQVPLHVFAVIAIGMIRHSQEMVGISFTKLLVCGEPTKITWCELKQDIITIGTFLLTKYQDTEFRRVHYQKHKISYLTMNNHCKELFEKDFSALSNEELHEEYSTFYEECKRFHGLTLEIDAVDIMLEARLKEKLEQLTHGKVSQNEFPGLYNLLTTPLESSYIHKEELELQKIAQFVKEDKTLSALFCYDTHLILEKLPQYKALRDMIARVIDTYWWTDLGWVSGEEKTEKTIINTIKKFLRNHTEKTPLTPPELRRQKEKIRKEFAFDSEMNLLLDIFENYSLFHDYRKEIQMKTTFIMNNFLKEVSRRQNQNYDDLRWCWPTEIKECTLTGKLDRALIQKRKEDYCYYVQEDTIEQYYGEEAVRKRKEEISTAAEDITDFQGIISCAGKVTGTVRICFSSSEAQQKVHPGDILVTSMTSPDFLPAMKQAAAIVTDEGGITCHAAIVSRELGIPCLVGTKIATKVLKDGDMVEVNANHGVVKIQNGTKE